MIIRVPSPLRSYTDGRAEVAAAGATLAEALLDLDRQFPGMRFRMVDEQGRFRQHILLFVNRERATELSAAVSAGDEVQIICAISGG